MLIAAVEKRKLVYVLNRDSAGRPTIASPLEAHRGRTVCIDVTGLDNGYDNPIFASLEYRYPDFDEGSGGDDEKGGKEGDRADERGKEETDRTSAASPRPEKQIAYYELDLGLNHVSRRWAMKPSCDSACRIVALPGGADGPGGVLVGGEDWIEYVHEGMADPPPLGDGMHVDGARKMTRIVCAIPRRFLHPPDKGVLITQMTVHRQKRSKFFALAQSELGDVYKVTVRVAPADKTRVVGLTISLLDTLPVGNDLNVSKLGTLFVPAEFGDHGLFRFERIDLEGVAPTCTSEEAGAVYLGREDLKDEGEYYSTPGVAAKVACSFTPTTLKNLRRVYTMDSLAPVTGVLVGELAGGEVSPQIYCLTGRGPRSSLCVLRHGVAVSELAVSDLPGVPGAVYAVRDNSEEASKKDGLDRYIVVSFADATMVLSVGETVEEMGKESGFLTGAPTLACSALGSGDGGICQVHPSGVRHIHRGRAKQWHCPGLKRIECASANESQVVIALAGGEVTYFELDAASGNLTEAATRNVKADVSCLDAGTVHKGRARSMFAAVGCRDQTVRVVSLEPGKLLMQRSSTALSSRPHSVCLQHMPSSSDGGGLDDLILTVGLDDGSSLRSSVDPITGALSSSPSRRFLGARPVSACRITHGSRPATLLLSSRPWISRPGGEGSGGKHVTAPLSYAPLDHACAFSSEAVAEGIVATAGTTLRILSVEESGSMGGGEDEAFNIKRIQLRYTPRQVCLLSAGAATPVVPAQPPQQRKLVLAIVEADCNDYGHDEKAAMGFDATGGAEKKSEKGAEEKKGDDDAMEMEESDDEDDKKEEDKKEVGGIGGGDNENDEEDEEELMARVTPIRGPVPSSPGTWGSCIRLLDPADGCTTLDCIEMNRNEAALCCASVRFHSRGGEALLAVGTVTGMTMHPLRHTASHVVLYRVVVGERLQLLHRTEVDGGGGGGGGPVLALSHFQGRLLVGVGRTLRLYEMGKRQLLRKCELRGLPSPVKTLQTAGDRAYVGDMMRSMHIVRYDPAANRLVLAANDRAPRPVTCQEVLDLNTVAVGDKFGNISVLRLPRGAEAGAVDVSGNRALWDSSREDSTPKLDALCHYHVGEVPTGMTRVSLVAGGAEVLVYVTVTGRIGALVPLASRDDVDFYSALEGALRTDAPRPTGREPQAYRSYYAPVKHVIDGDLCQAYGRLGFEEQRKIAERLDRTVAEVITKLEDTRNALL